MFAKQSVKDNSKKIFLICVNFKLNSAKIEKTIELSKFYYVKIRLS